MNSKQVDAAIFVGKKQQKKRKIINQRGTVFPVKGVLFCIKCNTMLHRDINAAKNIYHLTFNYLNHSPRPYWLQRTNDQQIEMTTRNVPDLDQIGDRSDRSKIAIGSIF